MTRGGQGNKGRKPGSGNKGYGPGSGRGFSGAGIGGNVGGFGKNKSPSGKNMSGQGGKNPFGKKGFGDKGQLSFAGLKNFLGIGNPDSNEAHRLKVGLRNNLDYSDMQEGPTIKINPKQWLGGFEDKTNIPTGWIRKNIPKWASGNWINHTLKSPKKIMPTDPRYNFGNRKGEKKLDKEAADYLNWIARANPTGMTVSEAKKLYKRQIDEGMDLKTAMKYNPAETGSFYALIDDTIQANNEKLKAEAQQKAETKALDTQYKNDQAIYNNNKKNMSVTISPSTGGGSGPQQTDDEWLSGAYKTALGRDFSKSKGGGQYWLDQMKANPTTHSRDEVLRMLQGSDEGKKYAASGKVQIGGIDPTKSISSQAGPGTWASHFAPGGVYENQNAAAAASQIAKDVGHTPSEAYFNTGVTDQTNADKTGTTIPKEISDGWWNQFADADAFKKFLQGDAKEETKADNGMGDFMKFMMLMSVMRPGGGGGYGGGGSQFGYGGLNPGGVQAAYDPMKSLQGMGTWFKDNFGSGGGTTTGNLNTP